jgi:hypothetical protein
MKCKVVEGCGFMGRLKALVVYGEGLEDYGDLLAVARAEAKRLLRTRENVNIKDILYSAKCGVYVIVFEAPDTVKVVADPHSPFYGSKVEAKSPRSKGQDLRG